LQWQRNLRKKRSIKSFFRRSEIEKGKLVIESEIQMGTEIETKTPLNPK
jgi:hypothetical protein